MLASCRTPATQIQLFIGTDSSSDRPINVEIVSFAGVVQPSELQSRSDGLSMGFVRLNRNGMGMGTFTAGGSVGILPPSETQRGGASGPEVVTVWIKANIASTLTSPEIRLDRAARLSFVRGRSGTARVFLPVRCGDRSVGCRTVGAEYCTVSVWCREQNATCGDSGECVAPELPVAFTGPDGAIEDSGTAPGTDATSNRFIADSGRDVPTVQPDIPTDIPTVDVPEVDVPEVATADVLDETASDVSAVLDAADDVPTDVPTPPVDVPTDIPSDVPNPCVAPASTRCGGSCVDTENSTQHCGGCGVVCPLGANGVPLCAMSRCTLSCVAGHSLVGSRCLSNSLAPRPIVPISLSDVTLRRPTLRWELPPEFDGAVLDLCRDRACMTVIESIEVAGTSARPTMDLPPRSVVFWRLRGRIGMMDFGTPSPTWLFHVPARDASSGVDTSGLTHLDVNGDGFDDIAIGGYDPNYMVRATPATVSVYHGSPMGPSAVPANVFRSEGPRDLFGYSVAGAGDLNGDGYGDLAVGAWLASPMGRTSAGTTTIYLGSPMGLTLASATVLPGERAMIEAGFSVASAGDVNRDGYGDLVVGVLGAAPAGRMDAGGALIYHGSAMGIQRNPFRSLEGVTPGDGFGVSVAGLGDINGDGYSDVAVGAWSGDAPGRANAGTASVFQGSPNGIIAGPTRVYEGVLTNDYFGRSLTGAGDINGDGYGDLLVGSYYADVRMVQDAGTATVYHGSAMGMSATPAIVLEGVARLNYFGIAVGSAGDINADGFGDMVVGAYFATSAMGIGRAGVASVYYGSAMGISMMPSQVLDGQAPNEQFAVSTARAGDTNGDGFDDLIVGGWQASPMGRAGAGTARLFFGAAMGIQVVPALVLEGAAAGDGFGYVVASANRRRNSWLSRWLSLSAQPLLRSTTL